MPSAIITTIGAADANSYLDIEQADVYFDDRLSPAGWTSANADDRTRALLQAARRLNSENWLGDRAMQDQALAWPRAGVIKPDGLGAGSADFIPGAGALLYPRTGYGIYSGGYGEQYASTEIPQVVKDAQCELALAYLEGFPGSVVKGLVSGGVTVEVEHSAVMGGLPPAVTRLIAGLIGGNRLIRG